MENEIKKLIEKYKHELALNNKLYTIVESSSSTAKIIKDLQSLLELYQSQSEVAPEITKQIFFNYELNKK